MHTKSTKPFLTPTDSPCVFIYNVGGRGGHITSPQNPAISLVPLFVSVLQDTQRMKYGVRSATFGPRGAHIFLERQEGWWDRLCEPIKSQSESGMDGTSDVAGDSDSAQKSSTKPEDESSHDVTPPSPSPSLTVFNIFESTVDHFIHTPSPDPQKPNLSSQLSDFIAALQSSHVQLPRSWNTHGASYGQDGAMIFVQSRDEEWYSHVKFEGAVLWDEEGNELEA